MSQLNPNFNSIKVRLKLTLSEKSIENLLFQFHKGTIETPIKRPICTPKVNFNSIKVRLKRASDAFVANNAKFQFHKGTIETHN